MQTYEVEIKSLLGSPERAQEVRDAIKRIDPTCKLTSHNKQLNHYFEVDPRVPKGGLLKTVTNKVSPYLSETAKNKLAQIGSGAAKISLRTRKKEHQVLIVVKASVDDTTSENGISRIEFEEPVDISLDALYKLILSAAFRHE